MDAITATLVQETIEIIDKARTQTSKDFNGALFVTEFIELLKQYEVKKKEA